ncbi:MAG: hypothetical protein WDW38_005361 [Sanguina aurantia]
MLADYDISKTVLRKLDSAVNGGGVYQSLTVSAAEVLQGVRSLARSAAQADALVKGGVLDLMVQILNTPYDKDDPTTSQAFDTRPECCRALLALSTGSSLLHNRMLQAGVVQASDTDLVTADAARGCLLQLGHLKDKAAVAAADNSADAAGNDALVSEYSIFLSHKRADAKDFARALYNLLVLRGFTTFLDFEYRDELKELGNIVSRCVNFVFVLTDNIFESHWCMEELQAAVDANINIILVMKEGSRWKDASGAKVCEFPSDELVRTLPEGVRKIFSRKALHHSDEYYAVREW